MIAFLDDDDLWPADSLERRWSILSARPDLGCVFGEIEQFTVDDPHRVAPRAGRLVGAMLARRSVFDRIGGFDETLRMGEMMQWCGRLEAAGIASGMTDAIVLRRRIHATNNSHNLVQQSDYIKVLRARLQQRRDHLPEIGA
jgi:GT2 family glycosyltransferase